MKTKRSRTGVACNPLAMPVETGRLIGVPRQVFDSALILVKGAARVAKAKPFLDKLASLTHLPQTENAGVFTPTAGISCKRHRAVGVFSCHQAR